MQPASVDLSLSGKVALVTGAARGIGRAIAETFLATDAQHVVCVDLLEDALAQIDQGERISTAVLDVTDEAGWQSLVATTIEEHGRIDVLVNNAGILMYGTVTEIDPVDFRRMLDVNVTGVFLGMRSVAPHMKARRSGAIVNTSSSSGIVPSNFIGSYAASKFAVRGLTRAAALELGLHGIRVNSIHPGGVNTPMTNPMGDSQEEMDKRMQGVPLQRYSRPDEIARGVVFLASDAASYCTGTELQIDGGMTAGIYFDGLPGSPQNP